ncbi:MAG: carbohydrate ABC transporter permease [Clostridia bacterium]|nr:carbohydrate ABC transporter permease [Clostridia bacterium]
MNVKTFFNKTYMQKKVVPFIFSLARLLLLIGISYMILIPLFTKLSLLFMESGDLKDFSVKWIPKHFTLENLRVALFTMDYWPALIRTIAFCLLIAFLQIAVTTISAYGFARNKSRVKNFLFVLVLASLLIPPQTYIVTLYTQFQYFDILGIVSLINGEGINIIDTIWTFVALAATGMGIRSGLYIYIEKQTFSALPYELEEAAKVDGAGMIRTFWSIMLPNIIPTMVMCFILSFIWHWNDTLYTGYFHSQVGTLANVFSKLQHSVSDYLGGWETRTGAEAQLLLSVGGLLCVLPLVLLFISVQRFFVQGVERSGLVG